MSSSSRSSRKRPALSDALSIEPFSRKSRKDVLSCEVETLHAELEHERSLRALDAKRYVKAKQRLETKVEFAAEELKETKSLMEELREEHDKHLEQLRRALGRTKEELLEVRMDLDDERALASRKVLEDDPRLIKLEDDLSAKETENDQLQETIRDLRHQVNDLLEEQKRVKPSSAVTNSLSEARPEVLQELNKVRVQLAESERKTRQYKRIAEEAQRKSKEVLQQTEKLRSAHQHVEQLQADVQESTRAHESLKAKLQKWQDLGTAMAAILGPPKTNRSGAPDISVLNQYLQDTKKKDAEAERKQKTLKEQLEKSNALIQKLESEKNTFARKEAAWKEERLELEKHHQLARKDVKVLRGQENVYKREVESLRSIVQTFDELPLGGTSAPPANLRVLEVSLQAARDESGLLKEAQQGLQKDLQSAMAEKRDLQAKHTQVLEKFGKLKDALYAERAKAQAANERAHEAELLAGKGSFNPDKTRVLHLGTNPLTMALKEEIGVLKKQVEVLTNGDSSKTTKYGKDVDPNKLHQRLKQSFKEQISRFREGVYLMTGYKVDMIPENDRYKFKVRSVFAERERDYLLFQWPEGKEVTSLDLLNTEYAKLLTKSPSYEYMTKFHSLPAFLASAQLNLFEKQTMM